MLTPVLLGLIVASQGAAQQPAYGPLTWEEGAPLQRLSLTPMAETAQVAERRTLRADLWLGYSNVFEQDSSETHVLFVDMERLITAATLRWGVAEGLEIGGRVTLETTGGGILDSFVLWYHDLLGFGQANRDRFPEDGYEQRLSNGAQVRYIDVRRRTLAVDDVRLHAKWRALHSVDERSVLSLRGTLGVPAQSNQAAARSTNAALAALGRLGVGSWVLHGTVAVSSVRAAALLEPILRGASLSSMLGVERALGSGFAAVLQYHLGTPALRGFHDRELDWAASNLVFGVAGRWGDAWRWDVSFQEDIPADTPAIDFTLGVRMSRRWR